MVRAAAKNHPSVAIVTSPDQYPALRQTIEAGGYTLGCSAYAGGGNALRQRLVRRTDS